MDTSPSSTETLMMTETVRTATARMTVTGGAVVVGVNVTASVLQLGPRPVRDVIAARLAEAAISVDRAVPLADPYRDLLSHATRVINIIVIALLAAAVNVLTVALIPAINVAVARVTTNETTTTVVVTINVNMPATALAHTRLDPKITDIPPVVAAALKLLLMS